MRQAEERRQREAAILRQQQTQQGTVVPVAAAQLAVAVPTPAPAPPAPSVQSPPPAAGTEAPAAAAPEGAMRLGAPTQTKQPEERPATSPADSAKPSPGKRPSKSRSFAKTVLANLAPPSDSYRANEILVLNLHQDTLNKLRAQGYTVGDGDGSGLTRLKLPPGGGGDAAKVRGQLSKDYPGGDFNLNFTYKAYRPFGSPDASPPDDLEPPTQKGCTPHRCYGPSLIEWEAERAACANGVKVGIIDTGFDYEHPAFRGIAIASAHVDKANAVKASNQHGTSVLALLAGNPRSNTPGLIPGAHFLLADAFFDDGKGEAMTDTVGLVNALNLFDRRGVRIVNLSLVGPRDEVLHRQIKAMSRRGVVFVAAAGNGGPDGPLGYPAAYDEVIAVTAVDRARRNYAHAVRGPHIDVAAPGVGIWTAVPGRKEGYVTGTSFATPFVTAIVAMTYKSTTLGDRLNPQRGRLDSANEMLKRIRVDPIGPGADPETYGRGLAQAPTCAPPPWTATVSKAPPDVQPEVQQVSWRPTE